MKQVLVENYLECTAAKQLRKYMKNIKSLTPCGHKNNSFNSESNI